MAFYRKTAKSRLKCSLMVVKWVEIQIERDTLANVMFSALRDSRELEL